jgi:hypothetical protein
VTSDWGSGFGGEITIYDASSTPINNWTLALNWDRTITSVWDAAVSSRSGNHYVVTNADWNVTIPVHGSVQFGFNGSPGNVGTDVPSAYALNGTPIGSGMPSLAIDNVTDNDASAGATAVFTLSLSQVSTTSISVSYATASGSAHAGTDYTAVAGTLAFSPGTLTKTISVPIIADTTTKPNLTFDVNLSNAAGAVIATGSGVGTIIDTIGTPPSPPVANNISAETLEGIALNLNVLRCASDPNGYALSWASFTTRGRGNVTENANSTLTYTPAATYDIRLSTGHHGLRTHAHRLRH